jgi:hypothetical protein
MSNTFEDILNASVVYVFTGRKIIEKNVLQFARIDSKTIFTRIEDMGIVIFEDGNPRVKKGESYVSLMKCCFGSDLLQVLRNDIADLRQTITNYRQEVYQERQCIKQSENLIATRLEVIQNLEERVKKKQIEIDNERSIVSQT